MQKKLTIEKTVFWAALIGCCLMWVIHVAISTASLQGLSDDTSLVFLKYLSHSYMFNQDSSWVHLFAVGYPREAQFALNALSLQALLTLGVQNADTFKYTFVLWQYALPGFLYLGLFYGLYRHGKAAWAIFPLMCWALLSVPVDWNPVNNTRWAVPFFWMYFFLVLFARPTINRWPLAGALVLGALMWGGLYETVIALCGLCLAFGAAVAWREKNKTPFLFALASVPGAIRAELSYITSGQMAPNSFHGILLPYVLNCPYFLLIVLTFAFIFVLAVAPNGKRRMLEIIFGAIIFIAALVVISDKQPPEWAMTTMKYDYAVLPFGLMLWAAGLRVMQKPPVAYALPVATLTLFVGAVLWFMQIEKSQEWQTCRESYETDKKNHFLLVDAQYMALMKPDSRLSPVYGPKYHSCLWGHYTSWADMLQSPEGRIENWSLLSFWNDFTFIEKNGAVYLHTNALTPVSPAMLSGDEDFPLKTPLYDITPLYEKAGLGPLFPRSRCMMPFEGGSYLYNHLLLLSDKQRAGMFVCPR